MKKLNVLSPYLEHPQRLADIMAAIQVMGTSKWDKRKVNSWKKYLGERPKSETRWEHVFEKHPEFFGMEDDRAFLRWRRAYERYHLKTGKEISYDEIEKLRIEDPNIDEDLARKPLTEAQISTLLNTAIELQVQATTFEQRERWLVPIVISSLTGLLGVIVGALLKAS